MRFALVPDISTPRCPECRTYPRRYGCECPAGYVDRLGRLRCVPCADPAVPGTEPISRHGVEVTDTCDACGVLVHPHSWPASAGNHTVS